MQRKPPRGPREVEMLWDGDGNGGDERRLVRKEWMKRRLEGMQESNGRGWRRGRVVCQMPVRLAQLSKSRCPFIPHGPVDVACRINKEVPGGAKGQRGHVPTSLVASIPSSILH